MIFRANETKNNINLTRANKFVRQENQFAIITVDLTKSLNLKALDHDNHETISKAMACSSSKTSFEKLTARSKLGEISTKPSLAKLH